MENQELQQILSKQLFTEGSNLIVKRVLSELIKFNRGFDGTTLARDQLIAISDTIFDLGKGLTVVHAVILAMIEDHWQEFDQGWRNFYNDDFEVFVFRKYGRKPGTIRADLRAVRIFLLNDKPIKPFGVVEVPQRNISGELLKDDRGKVITSQVEWDATASTLAKLKVAVPLAEQGKITSQMWSLLADDHVSSSQMIKTVYESTCDDPHPPQLSIRFSLAGPCILGYENGDGYVGLGYLDFEGYKEDPYSLKHRAMDKLLNALGLTLDEHVTLYKEEEEQHNGYYNDIEGTSAPAEE